MKELLELKEKTEKEVQELYQELRNLNVNDENHFSISQRYLDKVDFLKLIEVVYTLK